MVKAFECGIVVSEFELHLRYCVHFQTNTLWEIYKPPYPPSYELNTTTTVLLEKNDFGIKQPKKVDMLLNNQTLI